MRNDAEETWAVVGDKGFQGLQHQLRVVLPRKKKRNAELSVEELRRNEEIAQYRVVCENFYGRMQSKFKIMHTKYSLSKEEYPILFVCCAALCNYDISLRPLRNF
jgi:hypothetical protein